MKIKETPEEASPGQLCMVELSKVASDKLVGTFLNWVNTDDESSAKAIKERSFAQMYASVHEETRKDVLAAREQKEKATAEGNEPDIELLVENKRKQT